MKNSTKIVTRFTLGMTTLAPLFFAFLLTACNFQKQPEKISLDIPSGYTPAQVAKERNWEQVALDAERMAFSGPIDSTPKIAPPLGTASTTPLVAIASATKVEKSITKSLKPVAFKRSHPKKRLASTTKLWKPVRLISKKVANRKSYSKKLALND